MEGAVSRAGWGQRGGARPGRQGPKLLHVQTRPPRGAASPHPTLRVPCRWFHGKITREQAERLLYPPETGLFLVRESTNYPGDYTLCVSCEGKVEAAESWDLGCGTCRG
uniref:SH2 domain-containing protein n=1 Tax=Cyanistes caeruleus TaxID=156563 RepID=A0A8C0VPV3_CYACU